MPKTIRTVVIQGDDERVTLRMLLDAVDVLVAEAPDTARVKVYTDSPARADLFDVFFGTAPESEVPKWRVGARWDEQGIAPAGPAEEALP